MQKLHDLLMTLDAFELWEILRDANVWYHPCATKEKLVSLIIEKLNA